ncbi:MAG: hypothetical protein QOH67_1334 [Hyphomicrobiales bacterium]|jgi:hypothetical protein|nr:hypothetical protein [Hyphomicrobiales bacterium]
MAVIMNLAALPVKFVAIPILAGLAAGTGAVAAYVTGPAPAISASAGTQVAALPSTSVAAPAAASPTEQATSAKPETKLSCEQQTWPYLDNRCIARGNEAGRNVRFVVAPRAGEAVPPAMASLVTSDTVLRGPGVAPEASDRPVVRKPAKRSETRRQRNREANRDGFNRVYSVYSVPSSESARPVIVVRPLRLGADSPRF